MRIALFLVCLLVFCSTFWGKRPSFNLKKNYQRIVALAPSYCETMESLNLSHLVVGVSSHCQSEKFSHLPKVGTFAEPNFEAIMAQNPDLVLAVPHPMAKNLLDMLLENGIEIFAEQPDSLADIERITTKLSQKLNAASQGQKLVAQLRETLMAAQKKGFRENFLIAFSASPLVVAGKNTFPSEILEALGLKNMAEGPAWPLWPVESLIAHPPDILILADGHESLPLYQSLLKNISVDPKMIIAPNRPLFNSPSPKLVDDINYISELLQRRLLGPTKKTISHGEQNAVIQYSSIRSMAAPFGLAMTNFNIIAVQQCSKPAP